MPVKIKVLEPSISDIWITKVVFKYPKEKIWNTKGISLQNRITDDKKFATQVQKALNPKNLRNYIVKVDSAAPTRCIDGRMTVGWQDFTEQQKQSLGAKIAGGTAHAALAHRIVDVMDMEEDLLFEDDIKHVVDKYKAIDIGFGGHVDTHTHGWNTGCGSVDNINKILEKVLMPESQEQLRDLAELILGDTFDSHFIVNEVIGRMLFLDALKPAYMPKESNDPRGEFLYKKTVVELLRREAKNNADVVPQLSGEHGEVALVLNSVKGTTVDTDRFSFDHDGEIQVFGWDLWEMYEEASRLYPYSMYRAHSLQQETITNRVKHITVRTLLGIAAAMVLTDGSLKVVTVK